MKTLIAAITLCVLALTVVLGTFGGIVESRPLAMTKIVAPSKRVDAGSDTVPLLKPETPRGPSISKLRPDAAADPVRPKSFNK